MGKLDYHMAFQPSSSLQVGLLNNLVQAIEQISVHSSMYATHPHA